MIKTKIFLVHYSGTSKNMMIFNVKVKIPHFLCRKIILGIYEVNMYNYFEIIHIIFMKVKVLK